MLIIRCEKENGGNDTFVFPEMNSVEELNEYAKKELPVECYSTFYIHLRSIFEMDCFEKCYVYLNNYLSYKDITSYYYTLWEEEINEIKNNNCNSCKHYGSLGCWKRYKMGNDILDCINYQEQFDLVRYLKKKLFQ